MTGAVSSRSAVADIIDDWLVDRRFLVVASERILAEVAGALRRPYLAKRLPRGSRDSYLDLLRREAVIVRADALPLGVSPDPGDEHVLGAAVEGRVEYIVTGDAALLRLGAVRGIRIITPADLRELLRSEQPEPPRQGS